MVRLESFLVARESEIEMEMKNVFVLCWSSEGVPLAVSHFFLLKNKKQNTEKNHM